MSDVLHSLSRRSIEHILTVLEEADGETVEWLRRWHRAVLAKAAQPPKEFASENAHFLTRFGSWYDLHKEDGLVDQAAFHVLAEAHKRMHEHARWLAARGVKDTRVPPEEYDAFMDKVDAFTAATKRLGKAFRAALAELDPLTGVQNRQSMLVELERERSRSRRSKQPCCVALGDLDHFKRVNDTHGHIVGDQVLAAAAEIFLSGLRPYDALFRYGGEEFLFCLPETTPEQAVVALDRLRERLDERPVSLAGGKTLPVTASFSIASMAAGTSVEEVIAHADAALYRAKNLGRNRVEVWDEEGGQAAAAGAGALGAAKVARPQKSQKEPRR
ncbi:MAG: diguanylate cyclase [Alphaproteobacteria bacterium]|nr:diguanylate cyclase [Alphaproteobacteria bacterium]